MPRNFSQELSSITELSILMDFALIGDKDKWHFKAFALNYCSRTSSISCLMWSLGLIKFPEMCSYSYREWCRLRNYRSLIYNALKKKTLWLLLMGGIQGGSLLFLTTFPEIPNIHFSDLGRMKGWVDLGATQWDPWTGNQVPWRSIKLTLKRSIKLTLNNSGSEIEPCGTP